MSELDYMDALAAEYVLGSLDLEERTQARTLLEADESFAAKVRQWERRFGDLHLMVEPVEPESGIWARIKAKMSEAREQSRAPQAAMPPSAPEATAAEPPSLPVAEPPSLPVAEPPSLPVAEPPSLPVAEPPSLPVAEPPSLPVAKPPSLPVAEPPSLPVAEPPSLPMADPPSLRVAEPPSLSVSEPPSLDAIEAAISEAATTLSAEASSAAAAPESQAPTPEVTTVSEASLGPAPVAAPAPIAEPVPAPDATRTSAVEAVPSPPVAPAAAAAAEQAGEPAALSLRRQLRGWQAFAILMALVVLAAAALLAGWRFAPDLVPPMLQPVELLRQVGVTLPAAPAPRRPAPPESQFDE
jgi:hypothetical protein